MDEVDFDVVRKGGVEMTAHEKNFARSRGEAIAK
jgi:hypothetical protein